MQDKNQLLPMVQDFIYRNMPSGGYKMVSQRLKLRKLSINNQSILREVKTLKKDTSVQIIKECCIFMKENNVPLDNYCEDFLSDNS